MLSRGLFAPVVPEIEAADRLAALVEAERRAAVPSAPLRRLASLLPMDPEVASRVAARLKLSNKAKKRLTSAADASLGINPPALAYRIGTEGAVDRLLLAGKPSEAKAIAEWTPPRLPISGGKLIARGIPEGPEVARTLQRIEETWIAAGFPTGLPFEELLDKALN
jgi:poly(A) polymerase